jgi:hypothetical protein
MVKAALKMKGVKSDKINCTVPSKGGVDHVVLEIVAALNDLSYVNFDVVEDDNSSPSASMETYSAFTGLSQQAVATGLSGSVRLLCGNGNPMSGNTETDIALVASWIQAAEQTVLPMVRHGTFKTICCLFIVLCYLLCCSC